MPTPTKIKAQLTKITQYAEDVFKLDFAVERKYTRFKPGQFLHLTLEDFDPTQAYWPQSRVFSICSPPKSETISVIYSVKGAYTTRMRDELTEGHEYWLKLPYGDFIIEQLVPEGDTAVLIAGGTGISPYVSYLEQGLAQGAARQMYLAYAVRSPDRLAFDDLLTRVRESSAITQRIWSEIQGHQTDLVTDFGSLDLDAVIEDVKNLPTPHYLLSGPPGMLNAFSSRLKTDHGVDERFIHIDEWE